MYFLPLNDFKARVCQTMFLNTLSITEKAFRSWKIKERHGEDEDADDDQGINNQNTAPRREITTLLEIKH